MSYEDDDNPWLEREIEPPCKFDREYTRGLYDELRAVKEAQRETLAALHRLNVKVADLVGKAQIAGGMATAALIVYGLKILFS